LKNEKNLNKEEHIVNNSGVDGMSYTYNSYEAAARNRKSDEVTVYDPYEGGWKNVKSPFSRSRRGRFF
jgi:hypothetical protein